jgi:hypothetical protein
METGQSILPIHTGTLAPVFFPPFYRFVASLGPSFAPDLPLLELLESRLPAERRECFRKYPRISHDGVVLLRETWCVPAARLPSYDAGDPFTRFRRLRGWAGGLGLPQRVFVTPMLTVDILRRGRPDQRFPRLRKPFFVDWDSPCSHEMFRRFTRSGDATVVISEMLPAADAQPATESDDARATEYVFELYWL